MTDLSHSRHLARGSVCPRQSRKLSIWSYFAVLRQRRALAALDDTRLTDLGLTRKEAETEAKRPIWDVPSHWSE